MGLRLNNSSRRRQCCDVYMDNQYYFDNKTRQSTKINTHVVAVIMMGILSVVVDIW
jgi:hypothetical protein